MTTVLSEPATKADVTAAIDDLRKTDLAEIRSDITEIRADITEIRADITEIRADITEIRATMVTKAELKQELSAYATKADLETWGGALLAEMRHLSAVQIEEIRSWFKVHPEGTDAAVARVDHVGAERVDALRADLDAHRADVNVHRAARRRPARRRAAGSRRRPRTRR